MWSFSASYRYSSACFFLLCTVDIKIKLWPWKCSNQLKWRKSLCTADTWHTLQLDAFVHFPNLSTCADLMGSEACHSMGQQDGQHTDECAFTVDGFHSICVSVHWWRQRGKSPPGTLRLEKMLRKCLLRCPYSGKHDEAPSRMPFKWTKGG